MKKTAVGYAGGEKENPTYQNLGDYTETVRVTYNSDEVSFSKLMEKFLAWHDYTERRRSQYKSIVFCQNEVERSLAREILPEDAVSEIRYIGDFYLAEDYHQKYRLRHSELMEEFQSLTNEEFIDSREAAKKNAEAAGF